MKSLCIGLKYLLLFAVVVLLNSSCWYRQCPIRGCKVKYEHAHSGRTVRGRGTFPRIRFFGIKPKKSPTSVGKSKG